MDRFLKSLVFSVLILISGSAVYGLSLSDVRTQIRNNIRDTDSSRQRYSDSILNGFINEAQKDISSQIWFIEKSTSYVLTANDVYYDLPSDFLGVRHVVFTDANDVTIELNEKSEEAVIQKEPDYENSSTGSPVQYFYRQSKSGGTAFEISYLPVPTSTSTGTVRVDYFCQPTDLSSDSGVPFNGLLPFVPYHYTLVYAVTLRIKLIEAKTDEATVYAQLYDRAIQVMRDAIGRKPNYRPSFGGGPR